MKFYYALALCLITTFSLLAQTEIPLLSNPILEQAHAKWQQENVAKWLGDDYVEAKLQVNCAEEQNTLNYLTAGEDIDFFIDTFDLDGLNGTITCLNCEAQNFGTATLDSTSLVYISNSDVMAGRDTILVQFCTENNETCYIFDYQILVKREGISRTDPVVTLAPEENILYSIDTENLPGNLVCSTTYDCEDDYEGTPYMWVSGSKPNEFFYEASLYRGTDLVCFILCDHFTICDTVIVPFEIMQGNPSIQPPFMDDFSYDGPYPDKALWLDLDTYVNSDFSTNPVSVGMATFDGLNKNGTPYGGGFGKSDLLTSTYIDLGGASTSDNYYLSFWLQQQGLGDRPEEDDTMQLQFKNEDGEWVNIAIFNGVDDTIALNVLPDWKFYAYPVTENYLHDDFQFRFSNVSSRTGALDIWNLDYVRLTTTAQSPDFNDIAFIAPPSNILKNYTSMPWKHFKANAAAEVANQVDFGIYNHRAEPVSPTISQLIIREQQTGILVLDPIITLFDAAVTPAGDYFLGEKPINLSAPNSAFDALDKVEVKTTYTLEFDQITSPGYEAVSRNDMVSRTTHFDHYFAHDDGTAESNIVAQNFANQSVEIAVKFTANVSDSLRAFQMHIPHVTTNVNDQLFNFKVWVGGDTPDDTPEYEMKLIRPEYIDDYRGDSLQGFTTYPLLDEIGKTQAFFIPSGNFFIGWEQVIPCQSTNCLPVGYDKNTPEAAAFNFRNRNDDGWEAFPVAIPAGAVMIRPVFGDVTPGPTDVKDIVETTKPIKIFPNPAHNRLQLQLQEGDYRDYQVAIFNNTGQLLRQLPMSNELDITNYQSGIYFLKITNLRTQTVSNHKVVVLK